MAEEEPPVAAAKTKVETEAEITQAMLARLDDFKQQADNLTFEGVRRALEKDLGMERLSLDAHKKFIKQCLEKYFHGADDQKASETEGQTTETSGQPVKVIQQPDQDISNNNSDINKNLDQSPALDAQGQSDHESERSHKSSKHEREISEDIIKKAIMKRAPYFRSNLEITLAKVRRLLEEDLELKKNSLDAYKKFISSELDAALQSEETVQTTNGSKKEPKKLSKRSVAGKAKKAAKKASEDSDSEEGEGEEEEEAQEEEQEEHEQDEEDEEEEEEEDEEEEEEIQKPKKRPAQKLKANAKGSKRQKISAERSKASGTKRKKPVEADSEQSDGRSPSEDDHSQSSGDKEEVKKKNDKPAQVYGKRVEHLKSIIKACGLSVAPAVYRRVKQAPESKREARLIKELEEILEREGLSTDPSEKEIKAVKKRKDRARELEGIDMSNIVSSSRRRSSSSYIPLPKPKIEAESDEDEEGEEEEDEEENEDESDEGADSSEGSDADDAEEESD